MSSGLSQGRRPPHPSRNPVMAPLVPFAVAYGGGIMLGAAFSVVPLTTAAGLLILLFLAWWLVPFGQTRTWLLVAALLGGLILHQAATRIVPANDLGQFAERGVVRVIGLVDEPPQHAPDRTAVLLAARTVIFEDQQLRVTGRVRLSLRGEVTTLHYGDLLRADLRLHRPRGFLNPGGFDYGGYLTRQGIRATATVQDLSVLTKVADSGNSILKAIYGWRDQIGEAIRASTTGPARALMLAMIIGDTGFITQAIRERFMASGTTHILSISGSHLGMIAVVVFAIVRYSLLALPSGWLLALTRRITPTQAAALVTIPPVVFYTLLSGSQVATVRSLIMILVYLLAVLIQREEDLFNALALAALATLLVHPLALFEISFQLSYLSVLCLALVLTRQRQQETPPDDPVDDPAAGDGPRSPTRGVSGGGVARYGPDSPAARVPGRAGLLDRAKTQLALYGWMTLAAVVGTAPLVAFYFNQVAWVGLLANALVIPLVGLVALPAAFVCSVASLFTLPPRLPLAGLNQALFTTFDWLVQQFARLPLAEFHVPSPPLLGLLACYGALGLLVFSRARWLRGVAAVGLALLLLWLAIPGTGRVFQVTFLDVGQGDAALIEFPNGQTMLVDAGGAYEDFDTGRLAVAPYLWDRGIRRLDVAAVSHPQLDHIGGLPYLLKKFRVGEVWTNGVARDAEVYGRLRAAIREQRLKERVMTRRAAPVTIGACEVVILYPPAVPTGAAAKDFNNQALVLKATCGNHSVLFTGDIERKAERGLVAEADAAARLQSRVIKVPHHGSKGSLDPAFLRAVAPDVAVISVGARNPYGHPTPEALEAYRRLGAQVYRTDMAGAVIVRADGPRLLVATYRDLILQPVPLGRGMLAAELANYRRLLTRW